MTAASRRSASSPARPGSLWPRSAARRTSPSRPLSCRTQQAEIMKRHVDIAKKLGARVVGLKVGAAPEGTTNQDAVRMIVETLKRAAEYAHERDVFLAVENGGQISNDVELLSKIIADTHDLYV